MDDVRDVCLMQVYADDFATLNIKPLPVNDAGQDLWNAVVQH